MGNISAFSGHCESAGAEVADNGVNEEYAVPKIDSLASIRISAAFSTLWAFILFVLCFDFVKDIKGLSRWDTACVVMATAAALFASRSITPLFFSRFLPNLLVAIGGTGMHAGLGVFGGLRRLPKRMVFLLLIVAFII